MAASMRCGKRKFILLSLFALFFFTTAHRNIISNRILIAQLLVQPPATAQASGTVAVDGPVRAQL